MAPHSSILAWKIPWAEKPGGLQSMGSGRVGHDWAISLSLFTFMHWKRKWQPTPVFLPGESQGWESLVGCHQWSRTESDTTEVTWQQQQQQAAWRLKKQSIQHVFQLVLSFDEDFIRSTSPLASQYFDLRSEYFLQLGLLSEHWPNFQRSLFEFQFRS